MAHSNFDTEVFVDPQRWTEFHFFGEGGADGLVSYDITMGKKWRLKEIRVFCSAAFGSVEDLIVQVSAAQGSYFDNFLISDAMNGLKQKWYTYGSEGLMFLSDDHMNIKLSSVSAVYTIGVEVVGWAALG